MAAEKNFENRVKKWIRENGGYVVKYHASGTTKSGIPDLLICWRGYFIGAEIKAEDGKPSELQLYNLKEISNAGGICYILKPSQFEIFKKELVKM